MRSPILFVGAGPGDPDLITVKGLKAVKEADLLVVAGSLVNPAIYQDRSPGARVVDSKDLTLDEITSLMMEGYRAGEKVVRLHTGDPGLYGAIHEQMVILKEHFVPYKVIPGVTSALAASAALDLEWTIPEVTQTLIITRASGRTKVPLGEDLASLASHRASMAIYLSAVQGAQVGNILSQTYGPKSSVALCYRVSWPDEKIIWSTAENLAQTLKEAKLDRHTLMLAGPAVENLKSPAPVPKSRLYDPDFSHLCREAKSDKNSDL
jgi:precorrin-4/cobalt-precorrin-4 C11-methyltransferase